VRIGRELLEGYRRLTFMMLDGDVVPRRRLELFVSVCEAIQHTHHKGSSPRYPRDRRV
jgi:hypothetical protein